MSFVRGFRDFILRGNVVDLAVGVVIGAAFGDLVKSMVADVITPIIGEVVGSKPDFSKITLGPVFIGKFLNAVISFLIISAVIYFAVMLPMNRLLAFFKTPETEKEIPMTKDQQLLTEIRDALVAPRTAV